MKMVKAILSLVALLGAAWAAPATLSKDRMVFQTTFGDIHMAFYPEVAPVTVNHIRHLGELGAYNSNHFFRVDPNFVAQTADVPGGRVAPMDAAQRAQAEMHVPLEVAKNVKHVKGVLSMARHDDPNSGGSSFSILLGPAPHLDMKYAIFGEVTKGMETLAAIEKVETVRDGIFVMPKKRITIHSTYMYMAEDSQIGMASAEGQLYCSEQLQALQKRFDAQAMQLQSERQQRLPGS